MILGKESYEFDAIVNDITNHEVFLGLKHELHHGISRYEHSLRVAKMTYYLLKNTNLDYERATRAALLHDFYFDNELLEYNVKETLKMHPTYAALNAKKYFHVDSKQENIIKTHMFPLTLELPKSKESWVISLADKLVATHEIYRYKVGLVMGVWLIFIFNMITIQK